MTLNHIEHLGYCLISGLYTAAT